MSKYFLVMKQWGEGCDYMIDCGVKLTPLKAADAYAAISEAKEILESHGSLHKNSETRLEDCFVIEGKAIDMMQYVSGWIQQKEDEANAISEANYAEELAKLNKKFKR